MRLIEKLEGLSNVYFKTSMKHVATAQSKGEATNALFCTIEVLNDVMDYFGKEAKISDVTDDSMTVTVKISEQDMQLFAMQFATEVTVIETASLAEKCKNNILKAAERYEKYVSE